MSFFSTTEELCRRCTAEILQGESAEGGVWYILRKPEQIRASSRAGCRVCAIFEANLSLFDGFESMSKMSENWIVTPSAIKEAQQAPGHHGGELSKEEMEKLAKGRLPIFLVARREMIPLMGTMLCPWSPMIFILRHKEGESIRRCSSGLG
jgi:hypothetical protein